MAQWAFIQFDQATQNKSNKPCTKILYINTCMGDSGGGFCHNLNFTLNTMGRTQIVHKTQRMYKAFKTWSCYLGPKTDQQYDT